MSAQIAIIDCGAGNLHSVAKSFRFVCEDRADVVIATEARQLQDASHIVLPGVGAFADCMHGLQALPGMIDALNEQVFGQSKPFLGICVGMQLMLEWGLEHGRHAGLGWVKGEVRPITPRDASFKIPHMGWNELAIHANQHPAFAEIKSGDHMYFVHSYHAVCDDPGWVLAEANYGQALTAAIGRDTLLGVQFHPEKSQRAGLQLIRNFVRM